MNTAAKIFLGFIIVVAYSSCGPSRDHKDFTNVDPYKTRIEFDKDSKFCEAEKDRHSNKIQGREFGFKGRDTGYLGCMKLKGWDKISQ